MKRTFLLLSLIGVVCVLSPFAFAQTFQFNAAELIKNFDAKLRRDGGDVTSKCQKYGKDTECTFSDIGFKKSVAAMKSLDIANGHFFLKERLLITEVEGKVSTIIIGGDRGDPMNLFHFIGQFADLLMTLDPNATSESASDDVRKLGLMRGDSDPTIGEPQIIRDISSKQQ